MVRLLGSGDVRSLIDLTDLLDVIEVAFGKQAAGAVERPDRPHFPVGIGLDAARPSEPLGTGLVMPAYIHGEPYYVTKLVGVFERNPERGLPTVPAQVVVNDAETGLPLAFVDGTYVTAARTACVGGLSARALTTGPVDVTVIGAGMQGRWQARAVEAAVEVESITLVDIDESTLEDAVTELRSALDCSISRADDVGTAVGSADVVVTATTSSTPVFTGTDLTDGTVVVAIGAYSEAMQEIGTDTFDRAGRVFADVPAEVARIGDIRKAGIDEADLLPFATVFEGDARPVSDNEIVVVESVGSAVMDAAAAGYVYDRAVEVDAGFEVPR